MKSFRQAHSYKGAYNVATETFRMRFLSPFEESMNNRIAKENHIRTKPRLIDMNSTGGFGVTRKNKGR